MFFEGDEHTWSDVGRRKYRRVKLATKVEAAARGRRETLVTVDVSLGGLLIAAKKPYPANSQIEVAFSLPFVSPCVACRGEVSYSIEGRCMGIRFLEMSEESRLALIQFVAQAN
jgi:c-di-GMP-binding flagellar brake protein YcgR